MLTSFKGGTSGKGSNDLFCKELKKRILNLLSDEYSSARTTMMDTQSFLIQPRFDFKENYLSGPASI